MLLWSNKIAGGKLCNGYSVDLILDIPNWLHSTQVAQSRGMFIPDPSWLMIKSDQTIQGLQQGVVCPMVVQSAVYEPVWVFCQKCVKIIIIYIPVFRVTWMWPGIIIMIIIHVIVIVIIAVMIRMKVTGFNWSFYSPIIVTHQN